jgi:NADH oxidase (H2O2-forming)
VVAGLVTGESIINQDRMFADNDIEAVVDRVVGADPEARTVSLAGGREITYDKLVLGVGARPAVPPIEGTSHGGVFTLRSLEDAERIREFLRDRAPRKLVFVGAGFISLELASLLMETHPGDYDIDVVEMLDHPLPLMLDADLAGRIQDYLTDKGLNLRMGRRLSKIDSANGRAGAVELDSGERLDCDMVLLNVGATPNLDLAEALGIETGRCGIKVNDYLETSNPDVLAGGDCIENRHFITGKPVPIQLRGPAVVQGRLIAKRLAGYLISFPGVLGNSALRLFDRYVASTGLTETQAGEEGFNTVCATVDSRSKHGMVPGVRPWTLKLTFDSETERLLGGQILSEDVAPVKEIDAVNALILGGATVSGLTTLMCAGNPDCSSEPSAEPITICAEQALQKLRS